MFNFENFCNNCGVNPYMKGGMKAITKKLREELGDAYVDHRHYEEYACKFTEVTFMGDDDGDVVTQTFCWG